MENEIDIASKTSKKSCFRKAAVYIHLTLQIITIIGLITVICFYKSSHTDATCTDNPCQNGGTCIDDGSKTTCRCRPGFIGTYCHYGNPCIGHECKNGGTCYLSVGVGPLCACQHGYSGEHCEIDKDQCSPNPCRNRGECTQVGKSYRCTCDQGFLGNTCEKVDPCFQNPCKHNGMCTATGNTFHCTCSTQWVGTLCETEIQVDEEPPFLELNIAIVSITSVTLVILVLIGSFTVYFYCQFRRKKLGKKSSSY